MTIFIFFIFPKRSEKSLSMKTKYKKLSEKTWQEPWKFWKLLPLLACLLLGTSKFPKRKWKLSLENKSYYFKNFFYSSLYTLSFFSLWLKWKKKNSFEFCRIKDSNLVCHWLGRCLPIADTSTVGWSDIELFLRFSKTDTIMPVRYIFMSSLQSKKIGKFCRTRGKFFPFKKSQGL